MRSLKRAARLRTPIAGLTSTAALIALGSAAAPAGAASAVATTARKHPSPNGRCQVNINAQPRQVTAGDSVVVFGRLRCRGGSASVAGQTVTLLERTSGSGGFGAVQTTATAAQGFYELTVSELSANSSFYVRAHGAASGRRAIAVAAQVTLAGPPTGTQILTGRAHRVTFTGTVSPTDGGARVILQRQNAVTGNEWHRIDRGYVSAAGTFSITHTFVNPGDANLRVLVRSGRRNAPAFSTTLNYEVSQAENPNLTIDASTDPISYEQSVTISGTVSGASKQPVTLLAHTARQHGFAAIAEVPTNDTGEYTFPPQSPVQSTFYEVKGAGKASAVLYEGVQDAKTSGPAEGQS
jgi:hypothetical protein